MLTTGNGIQFVDILYGISIVFTFFATLLTLHYQKKHKKDPSFRMTQSALISFLCVVSIIFFSATFVVYVFIGITNWNPSSFIFYYTVIKIIVIGSIPYFLYERNKKLPKKQAPGTLVTDKES